MPLTVHEWRFLAPKASYKHRLACAAEVVGKVTASVRVTHPVLAAGSPAVFAFFTGDPNATKRLFFHGLESFASDPAMAVLAVREAGGESHVAGLGTFGDGASGRNADGSSGLIRGLLPSAAAYVGVSMLDDKRRVVGEKAERALLRAGRSTLEASGATVQRLRQAFDQGRDEETDAALAAAVLLQLHREGHTAPAPGPSWAAGTPLGTPTPVTLTRFRTAPPQASAGHLRALLRLFRRCDTRSRGRVGPRELDMALSMDSDLIVDSVALRFLFELHHAPQRRGALNPFEFVGLLDAVCVLELGELIVGLWEWLNGHVRRRGVLGLLHPASHRAARRSADSSARAARRRITTKRLAGVTKEDDSATGAAAAPRSRPPKSRAAGWRSTEPRADRSRDAAGPTGAAVGGSRSARSGALLPKPDGEFELDLYGLLASCPELAAAGRRPQHPDRALLLQLVRIAAAGGDMQQPLTPITMQDFSSVLELTDQAFYPVAFLWRWLRDATGGRQAWASRRAQRAKYLASIPNRPELGYRKLGEPTLSAPAAADPGAASPPPKARTLADLRAEFGVPSVADILAAEAAGSRASSAAGSRPGSAVAPRQTWSAGTAATGLTGVTSRHRDVGTPHAGHASDGPPALRVGTVRLRVAPAFSASAGPASTGAASLQRRSAKSAAPRMAVSRAEEDGAPRPASRALG